MVRRSYITALLLLAACSQQHAGSDSRALSDAQMSAQRAALALQAPQHADRSTLQSPPKAGDSAR